MISASVEVFAIAASRCEEAIDISETAISFPNRAGATPLAI
jgi:hypothetical protein